MLRKGISTGLILDLTGKEWSPSGTKWRPNMVSFIVGSWILCSLLLSVGRVIHSFPLCRMIVTAADSGPSETF